MSINDKSYRRSKNIEKKKKKHLKIQKRHPVLAVLLYVLLSSLLFAVIFLVALTFLMYYVDNKINNEYEIVNNMPEIYKTVILSGSDQDSAQDILSKFDHDYVIVGTDRHTVEYATCDATAVLGSGGYYRSFFQKEGIYLFLDQDNTFFFIGDYGNYASLRVVFNQVILSSYNDNIAEIEVSEGTNEDDIDVDVSTTYVEKVLSPYWLGFKLSDGRFLLIKCYVSIKESDAMLCLFLSVAVSLLFILTNAILIMFILRSILEYIKMSKLLFLDFVSDNHNWMWFKTKGEEILKKNSNAAKRFAVVHLVFIGYRNFVLCNSVEEGEDILIALYQILSKSIGKKELAAHNTSSSFSLLIEYHNKDELIAKLKGIEEEFTSRYPGYNFAFQSGVHIIDVVRVGSSRIIQSRRKIDLEDEYNHACTAQMTLNGSNDSGIAFYDDAMKEKQIWISKIVEHRQSAVENEEFKVYYQPKYDPRTNLLSGAEALIRWEMPGEGLVSPGRFIPVFEDDGFIKEIDDYMLTHVARDQRRWLDAGLTCVPVSVNVSRAHFGDQDLADHICELIDKEGTPHELLEIELTESAFFDNQDLMIKTIMKLKERGFLVSMDDFGSGYSSLNSLKDMPLDILKLDAGFFRDITDNDRSEIVVSEAIRLAKNLRMKTVAEGVEEKHQVDFLATEGCDMIQGYYFARPMPASDYESRLKGKIAPVGQDENVPSDKDEAETTSSSDDGHSADEVPAEESASVAVPDVPDESASESEAFEGSTVDESSADDASLGSDNPEE
ncbi:MAG: EAL domain-containing protein [Clostridiales bacterium]|nr:EAL domain-containing protein [Clostridiales bacterium]